MSKDVDQRVVEFQFDNTKFEKNIKQSQKSLNNFKESLSVSKSETFVDDFSRKLISFPNILKARVYNSIINYVLKPLDQVTSAIEKINYLINSMSYDQISVGWQKYADKTLAIATLAGQTIKVAGKEITDYAEKMTVVNDLVSKLNWFADETSYSLTDMTSNVGKFTAAGVDLDTAVEAMMGISNWASLSGGQIAEASRAMYNLSQALGAGYVKLIDWKSIQNANMDTQEFRATVLQTAVDLGELTKSGNEFITKTGKKFTQNQFTETLQEKWFSTKVLTETLKKYSSVTTQIYEMVQSTGLTAREVIERYGSTLEDFGLKAFKASQEARTFAQAINATKDAVSSIRLNMFEQIFGGYDEAKVLWSDFSGFLWDMFASALSTENDILTAWNKLGGRTDLFDKKELDNEKEYQGVLWNIVDAIMEIKGLGTEVLMSVFDVTGFTDTTEVVDEMARKLKSFTKYLQNATVQFRDTVKSSDTLRKLLEGISTILRFIVTVIQALKYALQPITSFIKSSIFDYLVTAINFLNRIITEYSDSIINKILEVAEVIEPIVDGSTSILDFIKKGLNAIIPLLDKIKNKINGIGSTISSIGINQNGKNSVVSAVIESGTALLNNSSIWSDIGNKAGITGKVSSTSKKSNGIVQLSDETNEDAKKATEEITFFSVLIEKLNELVVPLEGMVLALIGSLKGLLSALEGLFIVISAVFTRIHDMFAPFADPDYGLKNFVEDQSDLIHGILQIVVVITAIMTGLTLLYKVVGANQRLIQGINSALKQFGLGQVMKYLSFVVKELALLFMSFSASMVLLTYTKPEVIISGAVALTLLLAAIITLAVLLKNTNSGLSLLGDRTKSLEKRMLNLKAEYKKSAFADLADVVRSLAMSLLVLSASLALLSYAIDYFSANGKTGINNPLIQAGLVLSGLLIGIGVILLAVSKIGENNLAKTTAQTQIFKMAALITAISLALISFSASLYLMAKLFADEKLMKYATQAVLMLVGIIALMEMLSIVIRVFEKKKLGEIKTSISNITAMSAMMLQLSVAMLAFATAMLVLSKIQLDDKGMGKMWQFFAMMIVMMAALSGMAMLMDKYASKTYAGLGDKIQTSILLFNAVGILMIELASAVSVLSLLDPKTMVITMLAMTVSISAILLAISRLMAASTTNTDVKSNKFGMIIGLTTFLLALAGLFAIMIAFDERKILTVSISIIAIIASITAMFKAINKANVKTDLGAAFILLSLGLAAFAGVLMLFNFISLEALAKGLVAIGAGLAVIIIAGKFAENAASGLIKLAASIFLIGLSVTLVTAAIFALTNIFRQSVTDVTTSGDTLVNNADTFFDNIVKMLLNNKDNIVKIVGLLISIVIESILNALTEIVDAFISFCSTLADKLPALLEVVKKIVGGVLTFLEDNVEPFTTKVLNIISLFLGALSSKIEDIGYKAASVGIKLLTGIINGVADNLGPLIDAVLNLIDKLGEALIEKADIIAESLYALVKRLLGAVLIFALGLMWENVADIVGIFSKKAAEEMRGAGDKVMDAIRDTFEVHSPSKATREIGNYLSEGLALGMEDGSGKIEDEVAYIGNTIKDCWNQAINSVDDDGQLTIRPVVDTSGVEEGVNNINSMMSNVNGTNVSANMATATSSEISAKNSKRNNIKENQNGNNSTTNNNSTYNATFYIESNDPDYIAEEVDRSLKKKNINANLARGY